MTQPAVRRCQRKGRVVTSKNIRAELLRIGQVSLRVEFGRPGGIRGMFQGSWRLPVA